MPTHKRRLRGPFACKNCGTEYSTRARAGEGETYCSRGCYFAWIKTNHREHNRYTPQRVAAVYRKHIKAGYRLKPPPRQSRPELRCLRCNGAFIRALPYQRYCSDICQRQARIETKRTSKRNRRRRYGNKWRQIARRYGVKYESVDVLLVFERDGWRCQICGCNTPRHKRGSYSHDAPELDHRVPISKGGPHTYCNTQCACRRCNGQKGNTITLGQLPMYAQVVDRRGEYRA